MKKILSLVMALVMMLGCVAMADVTVESWFDGSALAGHGSLPGYEGGNVNYQEETQTTLSPVPFVVVDIDVDFIPGLVPVQNAAGSEVTIYRFALGSYSFVDSIEVPVNVSPVTNTYTFEIPLADMAVDGSEVRYTARVEYVDPITGDIYIEDQVFYVNSVNNAWTNIVSGRAWYPNNHAHAFGPKIDGSWKTFAGVDLAVEGRQEFPLIAAGAWNIGKVFVDVAGDEVTVSYQMHEDVKTSDIWDDITVDSEYVNVFAGVPTKDDIATESTFAFNTPISIANDLGGDTVVGLYLELVVDYPSHSPYVYRWWPNLRANKAVVEAMNALFAE